MFAALIFNFIIVFDILANLHSLSIVSFFQLLLIIDVTPTLVILFYSEYIHKNPN